MSDAAASHDPAHLMPFARSLGISVVEHEKDNIIGTLAIRDDHCTLGSKVHGGVLMALADTLGAIGGFLNLPEGAQATTTIESKTNFVGPAASGDTLTATTTPVSIGKRLSVWQTDIRRGDGRKVAVVTQTQLVL